jgi:[pyruvate, water dikinase]-phosphate phosphotransferase / [pyruvate, water dikinase] kinase
MDSSKKQPNVLYPMKPRRTVFFVSDRTGITLEALGKTLLTQFPGVEFQKHILPFVDTEEKAQAVLTEINNIARTEPQRPIVLSTLLGAQLRAIIARADALCLDLFEVFLSRLQAELHLRPSYELGLSHGMGSQAAYEARMAAVNYTLAHDDGMTTTSYADTDLILVGVSRSGKTPTCLYLAMQYGIRAANYPLTPDDFTNTALPKLLAPFRDKLFGLTITPERLAAIRNERKPGSRYASVDNCREEIHAAEQLLRHEGIPLLDTTAMSIEEIAITILHQTGLASRLQG